MTAPTTEYLRLCFIFLEVQRKITYSRLKCLIINMQPVLNFGTEAADTCKPMDELKSAKTPGGH